MSTKTESFIRELVKNIPDLRPVLEEHLSDNFGEILPHVVMSEIVRWSLDALQTNQDCVHIPKKELKDLLSRLEYWYSSNDKELQELICVSFLENLPYANEKGAGIINLLGQNLRKQLSTFRQL